MKKIVIPGQELWDPVKREFLPSGKDTVIQIEHSLISLSKWEAKWCKPFLSSNKTNEELIDYIRCMTLTQNVDPEIYRKIPRTVINEIVEYIEAPMTATTFSKKEGEGGGAKNQIVTNELIYYWMVALQMDGVAWDTFRMREMASESAIDVDTNLQHKESAAKENGQERDHEQK